MTRPTPMHREAVAVVNAHPAVGRAWWDPDRAAIRVAPADAAVAVRPAPGPLLAEHLDHWRRVYEFVYAGSELRHGDDLDLSGWRASDTGAPFAREHMVEWIDHAVDLILRRRPAVVLEVGCGSGLLLHRIRTHTRGYLGLDPAEPVVVRLGEADLPGVRVLHAAAHDLASEPVRAAVDALGVSAPDCIVLNSVTQCFPNEAYLAAVLADALDLVAPAGSVIVGDNRNLATGPDYAKWVESARNPALTADRLTARAAARLAADEELLCDPRIFARIARQHPRDVRTACYAKPMRDDTELTRYRFDVAYTVDAPAPAPHATRAWTALPGTAADRLRELPPALAKERTLITGIPNALLEPHAPDAAPPAELVGCAPAGYAVLFDSADGRSLALGPADCATDTLGASQCPRDAGLPLTNDPFGRSLRRRLPEILTDHLEQQTRMTAPEIVVSDDRVSEEPSAP